ncbi:glycogen debranching protein GlgX [Citreimonas sp.]|uniref:glycogen debranching protein GlgX n=1 Tax=Citreimonas sp. TaxID=3036715 RepID=UPI004057DB43
MKHDPTTIAFDRNVRRSTRLGADYDGEGTNFALWSQHATRVELCLYDETGTHEIARLDLPDMEGGIWHGYLPEVGPGQAYGYRVHGPFAPEEGHRFNPNKLLLDPYAMEIVGDLVWDDALFGYPVGGSDLDMDDRDSAPFMPKAVVVDPDFDWDEDRALRTPWVDTVVYETHVRGLTMRHPDVPETARGTFEGLGHPSVIEHLKALGVTTVELLPIHGFVKDRHLADQGLSNYWGYNSLSFFAPHRPYLASGHLREVTEAIRRFHKAGLEVILDVVYNHTAEGNEMGPTLSFRGIDNASYYLLSPDDPRHGFDVTGTGNTLNVSNPMVLRMVLDSLRYWVEALHVDGFRFDLASTLAREEMGFERGGAFFAAIRQDPVLRGVKLIAEPWDIGEGGYQVGAFPWPFREWNDKFRDDLRAFWRRDDGLKSAVSERLLGSPVQFDHDHRPATSSINFLAAHDGFTLKDTVSYNDKHNEANGEDGRDGHDNNLSDNCGIEGETGDEQVIATRKRRLRSMLASLFVSQGVPMLLAGDEFGQTQGGNNNAYNQDNETTWLNWERADADQIRFTGALARLRSELGMGRERFAGHDEGAVVRWWHPEGREASDGDWSDETLIAELTDDEHRTMVILNAGDRVDVTLPRGEWGLRLDTARDEPAADEAVEGTIAVDWQSVVVLTHAPSGRPRG